MPETAMENGPQPALERKPKGALLPLGRGALLYAGFLLFIGVYKSLNLLALLGYFILVAMFVNAFLSGYRLRQIRVRRHFPDPLYAGQEGFYQIEMTNSNAAPVPPWCLIDLSSSRKNGWSVQALASGASTFVPSRIHPLKRGVMALAPLEICGSFPFGLVQNRHFGPSQEEVLILPKTGTLRRGSIQRFISKAAALGDSGKAPRFHPLATEEFHGLRPFRQGDNPKGIHWRTSARRGELMVRDHEDYPGDDILIAVDPGVGPGDDLEELISLAATICVDLCKVRGNRLVFAIAGREPVVLEDRAEPSFGLVVLRELARCQAPVDQAGAARAQSRVIDLLSNTEMPPAALILARRGRFAGLILPRDAPAPVLDAPTARELGLYEPPASERGAGNA